MKVLILRYWRLWVTLVVIVVAIIFVLSHVEKAYIALLGQQKPIDTVLQEIEARRALLFNTDTNSKSEKGIIHVLVLGLDARKGWDNPHCDAIHMFSLNTHDWSIDITSVPRGTYAYIPPGNYLATDYYLANACGYVGLDYGIEQIEKIVGVKADYYVTVGFSEVYGILRTLKMPTTQSLQWLRHRQSYAIGDPQRSHNQAVFMKDLILRHTNTLRNASSPTFLFLLHSMTDTNMDFATAKSLVGAYMNASIDERPEAIRLSMKPYHPVSDLHFDFENPDAQIDALLNRIRPYLSKDDLSDKDIADYQKEIISFLEEQINTPNGVKGIMEKKLWLQIEDQDQRLRYHYRYMDAYVRLLINEGKKEDAKRELTDYILEYTALQETEYIEKGEMLLRSVIQ